MLSTLRKALSFVRLIHNMGLCYLTDENVLGHEEARAEYMEFVLVDPSYHIRQRMSVNRPKTSSCIIVGSPWQSFAGRCFAEPPRIMCFGERLAQSLM